MHVHSCNTFHFTSWEPCLRVGRSLGDRWPAGLRVARMRVSVAFGWRGDARACAVVRSAVGGAGLRVCAGARVGGLRLARRRPRVRTNIRASDGGI